MEFICDWKMASQWYSWSGYESNSTKWFLKLPIPCTGVLIDTINSLLLMLITLTLLVLLPSPSSQAAKCIYSLKVQSKIEFHYWHWLHNSVPLDEKTAWLIPQMNTNCVLYGYEMEDHIHLFTDCPLAVVTWTKFLPQCSMRNYQHFFRTNWND